MGRPPQYAPAPCKLTFDLLILKLVSESRVMWATSVPILVFLGLSVLNLGPMYVTDRQTDVRQHHRLIPPPIRGGGITKIIIIESIPLDPEKHMGELITPRMSEQSQLILISHHSPLVEAWQSV